MEVLHSLRLFY